MRHAIPLLALTGLAAGISACTSTPDSEDDKPLTLEEALADPRVGDKTDRLCFSRSINGFREWDGPDGVILTKGASDDYLVTVTGSCLTIDRAQAIGVDERFGGGCLTRGDYLVVSDTPFARRSSDPFSIDRCLITGIYEWDEDKAASDE